VAASTALLLALIALASSAHLASAREADRDCSAFPTQAAAQSFFVAHGGSRSDDFDDLDGNGDGIACNDLPCPCSKGVGEPPEEDRGAAVPSGARLRADVVRDVDGDTIYVRYRGGAEGYVRLIGIDTPEDAKPGYPVERGSRAAARSMERLASGRQVTLLTDPSQDRFDRYGRLLAYVIRRGRDLNRIQVARGWADVYVYDDNPFERVASYREAEAEAKASGEGVWGRCGGDFHSAA
jgi:endonuclease YncB( thermonuclease family)